jgi:hypothetical protein
MPPQAEPAGQLTDDERPNPQQAASRQATRGKQNIRLGMSPAAAGAVATGAPIGGYLKSYADNAW